MRGEQEDVEMPMDLERQASEYILRMMPQSQQMAFIAPTEADLFHID